MASSSVEPILFVVVIEDERGQRELFDFDADTPQLAVAAAYSSGRGRPLSIVWRDARGRLREAHVAGRCQRCQTVVFADDRHRVDGPGLVCEDC